MKVAVDTNVLVRCVVDDDEAQARAARRVLAEAEVIVLATSSLCEFVWVLRKVYKLARGDIALALRTLLQAENVVVDRPAAELGLSMLDEGGDFADGVIAFEGRRQGGETFVSFDKDAVARLAAASFPARLLA